MPNRFTAVDLVQRDVETGLAELVAPRDEPAFALPDAFQFIGDAPIADEGDRVVVVPWEWRGVHVQPLLGIVGSGRDVVVRGVTLVSGEEGAELLHRYIDWADVLQQIGARVYGRPVVDAAEHFGDDLLRDPRFARASAGGAPESS